MAERKTIRSYRLGQELQRLRSQASLSQEALIARANEGASKIVMSLPRLSRIEQGYRTIDRDGLDRFIEVLDVGDIAAARLRSLWVKVEERGWWFDYRDILDDMAEQSIELAEEASEISAFESVYVQALVQTEDYARAVIDVGKEFVGVIVADRILEFRMRRQERLGAIDFSGLKVVLTESVLRHQVGSRHTMRRQLKHLCDVAEDGKVSLRVIPFSRGPWSMYCSSQLFSFAVSESPSFYFISHDAGRQLFDDPKTVRQAAHRFSAALKQALSLQKTLDLICKIRSEM